MTRFTRGSALALLLVAGLGLALAPTGAPGQQQIDQTVQVGSWNVEHLGQAKSRSGIAKGVAQTPADLADYIARSKVDVLALQEIYDTDGVAETRTNGTLAGALDLVGAQAKQTWKYVMFPKADPDDTKQHCVLAWNADKVKQVGDVYKVDVPHTSPDGAIWDRHPHAVKLSFGEGKTDVVLVVLHLKSNYDGVGVGRKRRHEEAKTLMAQLGAIQAKFLDFDVVVFGDTNVLNKNEMAVQAVTGFGFKDLNSNDDPTFWTGGPFDRFFVPADQSEFAGAAQDVFDTEYLEALTPPLAREDFKKRFSDHFMVRTKIKVLPDDDQ